MVNATLPARMQASAPARNGRRPVSTKRVAFVTGEYPPTVGGVADYTRHLAHALADRGHAVSVITTSGRTRERGDDRIEIRPVPGWGPAHLSGVRQAIRELRPDVVSFQYVPQMYGRAGVAPVASMLPTLAARDGARVICTMHEVASPLDRRPRRLAVALAHRLQAIAVLSACDSAIVTNAAHGRFVRALTRGRRTVHEIPAGASVLPAGDDFGSDGRGLKQALGGGAQLIGDFSPLAVGKQPRMLLALAQTLGPGTRFVMMGGLSADDGRRAAFVRAAEAAGVAGMFVWTGPLATHDLSRHLAALDLYVHTNAAGTTGGSTTLASALAHGIATVAFRDADTPDCFGEGGIALVASNDTDAFAARVNGLLAAPSIRARLGEEARALYSRRLAWNVIAEQVEEAMS